MQTDGTQPVNADHEKDATDRRGMFHLAFHAVLLLIAFFCCLRVGTICANIFDGIIIEPPQFTRAFLFLTLHWWYLALVFLALFGADVAVYSALRKRFSPSAGHLWLEVVTLLPLLFVAVVEAYLLYAELFITSHFS